jgi:hypothetical protein
MAILIKISEMYGRVGGVLRAYVSIRLYYSVRGEGNGYRR